MKFITLLLVLPLLVSAERGSEKRSHSESDINPLYQSKVFINKCVNLIEEFSKLGISKNESFIDDKDFFTRFFKERLETIRLCSLNLQFKIEPNQDLSFEDNRIE